MRRRNRFVRARTKSDTGTFNVITATRNSQALVAEFLSVANRWAAATAATRRAHSGTVIPNAGIRRVDCRRETGGIQQYGQRLAARQTLSPQPWQWTFRRMKIA
jgi:hypothetical protein